MRGDLIDSVEEIARQIGRPFRPSEVQDRLARDGHDVCDRYAANALGKLAGRGVVRKLSRGRYEVVERGPCDRCDSPGGRVTFENQASMVINGRVQCIDWCIHRIVAALNAGGVRTVASCCGHGEQDGRIDLEDGRVLIVRATKHES